MGADSRSFVRKSFYINPPGVNASAEEWMAWQEKDDAAARAEKAKFTRARNKALDADTLPQYHTAKVNGRYKQVTSIAFSAEGETEPLFHARQEVDIDRARAALNTLHKSGGERKGRNKANRIKLRQARKAKYRNRQ